MLAEDWRTQYERDRVGPSSRAKPALTIKIDEKGMLQKNGRAGSDTFSVETDLSNGRIKEGKVFLSGGERGKLQKKWVEYHHNG